MLVSTYNGCVEHHVFVVVIAGQHPEDAIENTAIRPSAKALMHRFPMTEARRQITPGTAGSISVEHRFNEETIVFCSAANMTFTAGKNVLDPIPLIIVERVASHRSAPPQADRPRVRQLLIWES